MLFLKEVPLGNRSGIEQLLEEEGAMLAPATSAARGDGPSTADAELDALEAEQNVSTQGLTHERQRPAPLGRGALSRLSACGARPRGPR